jgi:hypothetical protein
MNPIADTVGFLTQPQWPVYVFWLLLLGTLGLAVMNLLRDPEQRTGAHVWLWLARLLIGAMWWQQTLWKLPPSFDGLHYWLDQIAQHAAFATARLCAADRAAALHALRGHGLCDGGRHRRIADAGVPRPARRGIGRLAGPQPVGRVIRVQRTLREFRQELSIPSQCRQPKQAPQGKELGRWNMDILPD